MRVESLQLRVMLSLRVILSDEPGETIYARGLQDRGTALRLRNDPLEELYHGAQLSRLG